MAAERDLEEIWKYTRDESGLEQADRYVDMLSRRFHITSVASGRCFTVTSGLPLHPSTLTADRPLRD